MSWKEFLAQIKSSPQVTLVGPLYDQMLEPSGPTIFVDGGANFHAPSSDRKIPVLTVGDGDSTSEPMDIALAKDKNLSDLAVVLHNLPNTIEHIEMYGFLGGRRDHELLNLGEVHHFLSSRQSFTSVRFNNNLNNPIIAFAGGALSVNIHGTFSVIVFQACAVTIEGACAFPVQPASQFNAVSSLGLSNRGAGQIVIQGSGPCFVFLDGSSTS